MGPLHSPVHLIILFIFAVAAFVVLRLLWKLGTRLDKR
jgi:hypothetical protein